MKRLGVVLAMNAAAVVAGLSMLLRIVSGLGKQALEPILRDRARRAGVIFGMREQAAALREGKGYT